jgi:hypothetical protein
VFEQIKWERDMAMQQLEEHGIPFGGKADDVVEVVRCKDCANCRYVDAADIYRCDRRGYYSEEVKPSDYCSRGERKEQT